MYDGQFDGLDLVTLVVADAAPLVELYRDRLGFAVVADEAEADPRLGTVLGLSGPVSRVVHLGRGDHVGGALLLVESALAPAPTGAPVPPARPGPYALDFYLRDSARTEAELEAAGWAFTSGVVHYDLPGTTLPVRERMLVQPHSGLLHALVQHRPRGTRSVLGEDEAGWCSEVVAVVVLTRDLAGARRFAADVLGGREYYRGTFAGPAMETMLGFGPGEGLEASLFRGPASRNARLEFARPVDAHGEELPWNDEPRPAVLPALLVDDLDPLLARLGGAGHGDVGADEEVGWRGRRVRTVRFDTAYDVSLLLLDRGPR